jgi:acyl dehydratase
VRVISGTPELRCLVGETLGVSDWIAVPQDQIDDFADATDDHQWIHVDPVRAASGPFGSTIAHGYLTLALIPSALRSVFEVRDVAMAINYGLDRVRFPAPVRAGAAMRLRVDLVTCDDVPGGIQIGLHCVWTAEGATKPACVADVLVRYHDRSA